MGTDQAEPEKAKAPAAATMAGPSRPAAPSATLTVGSAHDAAEAAADRAADEAISRLTGASAHSHGPGCGHGGFADLEVRRKVDTGSSSSPAIGVEGGQTSDDVSGRIDAARGKGSALPAALRRSMESAFGGKSFSGVRIHSGAEADRLNQSMGAQAFTTGKDVFLGSATPSLETTEGQHTLAHELAHTLQPDQQGAHRKIVRRKGFVRAKIDFWESLAAKEEAKKKPAEPSPAPAPTSGEGGSQPSPQPQEKQDEKPQDQQQEPQQGGETEEQPQGRGRSGAISVQKEAPDETAKAGAAGALMKSYAKTESDPVKRGKHAMLTISGGDKAAEQDRTKTQGVKDAVTEALTEKKQQFVDAIDAVKGIADLIRGKKGEKKSSTHDKLQSGIKGTSYALKGASQITSMATSTTDAATEFMSIGQKIEHAFKMKTILDGIINPYKNQIGAIPILSLVVNILSLLSLSIQLGEAWYQKNEARSDAKGLRGSQQKGLLGSRMTSQDMEYIKAMAQKDAEVSQKLGKKDTNLLNTNSKYKRLFEERQQEAQSDTSRAGASDALGDLNLERMVRTGADIFNTAVGLAGDLMVVTGVGAAPGGIAKFAGSILGGITAGAKFLSNIINGDKYTKQGVTVIDETSDMFLEGHRLRHYKPRQEYQPEITHTSLSSPGPAPKKKAIQSKSVDEIIDAEYDDAMFSRKLKVQAQSLRNLAQGGMVLYNVTRWVPEEHAQRQMSMDVAAAQTGTEPESISVDKDTARSLGAKIYAKFLQGLVNRKG